MVKVAVLGCVLLLTGCETLPFDTSDEVVSSYQRPQCRFGQGGMWKVLQNTDPATRVMKTYIAVFANGGPYDIDHVTCLIPLEDPIMALEQAKGKPS